MNEPKYKPIPFTAPMVRAILGGRKTQTRRIVKSNFDVIGERVDGSLWPWRETDDAQDYWYPCPYGQPGDRLWVKEIFAIETTEDYEGDPGILPPEGPYQWVDEERYRLIPRYRATAPDTELMIRPSDEDEIGMKWTPSRFMPRWASRITLEVTGVRVELLGDIRESDAIAEGTPGGHGSIPGYNYSATPVEHYRHLWGSINGKGSWEKNPWVWVVEFKRVED